MMKLIEANIYITYIVGALFLAAVFGIIISVCVTGIVDKIKHRKFIQEKERLLNHLNKMIDWCSYEYPGVLDICQNLKDCLQGRVYYDVDHIREILRRKYPRENVGPFRTVVSLAAKSLRKQGLDSVDGLVFEKAISEAEVIVRQWDQ